MRKNSMKNTRINGEVQRVLAEIIRGGIKDPRISPLTSVLSVEVAPDLKTCKAWISVYGDEKARTEQCRRIYQKPSCKGDQSSEYTGDPVYRGRIHCLRCQDVQTD